MNLLHRIPPARVIAGVLFCAVVAAAQLPQTPAPDAAANGYRLGAGDQILIHAPDSEELNEKQFEVGQDGVLALPLAGSVEAAGLSADQLAAELSEKLRTYIRNPVVSISVTQFRASSVFFVGAFLRPGAYPLQGRHTLAEMLLAAGGVKTNAARRLRITRREDAGPLPISGAAFDPHTRSTSAEIGLGQTQDINPGDDIILQPNDTISADKLDPVYTEGALASNGGFEITEKGYISVLQLISIAGGLTPDALPERAVILRPIPDSNRRAGIPVDLKLVLKAAAPDIRVLPNDVLFVPRRKSAHVAGKLGVLATSIIPSVIVYSLLH